MSSPSCGRSQRRCKHSVYTQWLLMKHMIIQTETWKLSHFSAAPSADENSLMWCQANHKHKNFETQTSPEGTPIAKLCSHCFISLTPIMSCNDRATITHYLYSIKRPLKVFHYYHHSSQNVMDRKSICAPERKQQLSACTVHLNSLVYLTVHGIWQDKNPAILTLKYHLICSFFTF